MRLPPHRGELSHWLTTRLTGRQMPARPPRPQGDPRDAWQDDDLQLALWCCYELHYRGFDDVADEFEWDLDILAFRQRLEQHWLACLNQMFDPVPMDLSQRPARLLRTMIDDHRAPELAKLLQRRASIEQFREFVLNRSVYQLKEADPHTFGIPRLDGDAKAALVEIQADEYGGGRSARMHSTLFRQTMRWLGLSEAYGYYVPEVSAATLAVSNGMSLFAVHRRWIGALLGHLAVLEMTSTEPNRRYAAGARRLGADDTAAAYFDEHVEADAVHEQIAAHDLCGSYVDAHPRTILDVAFGAHSCLALESLFASDLMEKWQRQTREFPEQSVAAR